MSAGLGGPLRLRPVAARKGVQWVRQGFTIFARRPLAFTGMFAAFLFGAVVFLLIPLIGGLLLMSSLPLLTLGFMLATRVALEGGFPTPKLFVAPLAGDNARRKRLLQLGLAYALATLALMLFVDWIDAGKFDALQSAYQKGGHKELDALLADPQLQAGMLLRLALASLLALPFWHAPALVFWAGQGFGQSLFSSTLACWRARGALLVYGLVWAFVIGLFGIVMSLVFAAIGSPQMAGVAALPAALLFSTVFYASLYFTFADSFDVDELHA